MKKITVKTSYYKINADVVVSDSEGAISVEQYAGVSVSSAKRENAKHIRAQYEDEGFEVIAIRNMGATIQHLVDVYRIDATNEQIINACREYGLNVTCISDEDEAPAESEEA